MKKRIYETPAAELISVPANDVLTESYDNPGGGDNGGFDIFSIFNINKDFE